MCVSVRGKDKASRIVKMNPGCEGGMDEPVNLSELHACGISIVGLTTEGNVHLLKLFIMYQSNYSYGMYHKGISLDSLIVAVTKAIFFEKATLVQNSAVNQNQNSGKWSLFLIFFS